MTSSACRIITTGLIGQYPIGGNAWAYFQYVLGLSRLGHDVFYVEDTGQWPFNPEEGGLGKDCDYNVRYIKEIMEHYGLADRWAYRFPWESRWFGLSDARRQEILDSADLVINVSGTLEKPSDYGRRARLAYVDTDPVFTQIKLAAGHDHFRRIVDAHDVHFSFGEAPSDRVPDTGHEWIPTRQPVVMDEWAPLDSHRDTFTTVMNWTSYKQLSYDGKEYGQKDVEFMRFLDLPGLVSEELEVAMNVGKNRRAPFDLLRHKGWRLVNPADACPDLDTYRDYIRSSKGEWTVAKNGYVEGRSGWFSERSAVYLAAGRPVVTQETGFSSVLPVGEGLKSFATLEEAADAIREVSADPSRHRKAASSLAEEYFDSAKVLTALVDRALP